LRHKITLSIQPSVKEKGQQRADEMFSGNFSMYITYLINKDVKGIIETPIYRNDLSSNIPPKQENDAYEKRKDEIACAIDNILGID